LTLESEGLFGSIYGDSCQAYRTPALLQGGVNLFFFQAEDGIRYFHVTGVQTCALPISSVSVIPPTPPEMILTCTSSLPSSLSEPCRASSVPRTSVLITRLRVFFSPWPMFSNMFSSLADC